MAFVNTTEIVEYAETVGVARLESQGRPVDANTGEYVIRVELAAEVRFVNMADSDLYVLSVNPKASSRDTNTTLNAKVAHLN